MFLGKRMCPGKIMAEIQIFIYLSSLIKKFTFELDPNSPFPDVANAIAGFVMSPPHHKLIVNMV